MMDRDLYDDVIDVEINGYILDETCYEYDELFEDWEM